MFTIIQRSNSLYMKLKSNICINLVIYALLNVCADSELAVWITKNNWSEIEGGYVFIGNQEETVKTKNITEKIEFDSVATIMASCR